MKRLIIFIICLSGCTLLKEDSPADKCPELNQQLAARRELFVNESLHSYCDSKEDCLPYSDNSELIGHEYKLQLDAFNSDPEANYIQNELSRYCPVYHILIDYIGSPYKEISCVENRCTGKHLGEDLVQGIYGVITKKDTTPFIGKVHIFTPPIPLGAIPEGTADYTVDTNELGQYEISLPPAPYSIYVEIDGALTCNNQNRSASLLDFECGYETGDYTYQLDITLKE